jgi:cation-transporting ATPase E
VLESAGLELDESLLTGEADPVAKRSGDTVRSGSFVVAGSGAFVAVGVGDDAYANRLVADVRRFELAHSELMTGINRILRVITRIILPLGVLLIISQLLSAGSFSDAMVGTVAGIVPTIPEGLVLMTSVAFAVGVVRLAQRRCLVQELPAIEMLARVDVLCLDKTGTLTAPEMDLDAIIVAPAVTTVDEQRARAALAALARMEERPNATVQAIADGVPAVDGWTPTATLPFSSARKYSGATFGDAREPSAGPGPNSHGRNGRGTWCLGAPDVVLAPGQPLREQADQLAAEGLRVLALVELADGPLVHDGDLGIGDVIGDRLTSPIPRSTEHDRSAAGPVRPMALVVLRQRLRPEASETMRYLAEEGVTLKIFSGDHAASVGAVAAAAGIPGAENPVDARTLPTDDQPALTEAMRRHAVFGRVTPEQKRAFVDALRADGHTVGMTGDGVNDALALKNADLGIAMGSGSPATRGVAKVVLLDNNFGTMPHVLAEGRRVLGNIERVASLFLVKTTYSLVLAILVGVAHVPFPLLPRHVTLVGSLTIGIPGFFLALAPNTERFRPGFVARVLGRAAPAGLVAGVAAFVAYGLGRLNTGSDQMADRSTAALTLFLAAAWMLALVARPYTWWRIALVASMVGAFAIVAAVPFARHFFALDFSDPSNNLIALVIAAAAALVITVIHRMDGGSVLVGWFRVHVVDGRTGEMVRGLSDRASDAGRRVRRAAVDIGRHTGTWLRGRGVDTAAGLRRLRDQISDSAALPRFRERVVTLAGPAARWLLMWWPVRWLRIWWIRTRTRWRRSRTPRPPGPTAPAPRTPEEGPPLRRDIRP